MDKKNILIAVAWPYVNGDLHVGHVAGYLLPADITARFFRLSGHKVLMVSGSDCFGTPITVEADKRGISPREVVNEYHARNLSLFKNLGLTFDLYTKTDTDSHREITQEFLLKFWEKDLLIVKSQNQYFSDTLNRFLPDRYVEGVCPICKFVGARSDQCDNCGNLLDQNLIDPVSKIDKKPVSLKETKHLFVKWDKIEEKIKKYVDSSKNNWRDWIKGETQKWLDGGLKERAVTRDLDWGVEIPQKIAKELEGSENKRVYVWFDAVIGYYSASRQWAAENNKNWEDFWCGENINHYYFMGKDNLVFHTIFWPGQLITYNEDLHLPDYQMINQYLNLDGQKFSKSRGVVVDTAEFIEKFSPDSLRFYLTSIMPETSDASFTWNDFYNKNNSLLVGHIGNFIHRTLSLYNEKSFEKNVSDKVFNKIKDTFANSSEFIKTGKFKAYLAEIESLASFANSYIDEAAPWFSKKNDIKKFEIDGADLISLTVSIMSLMEPITPNAWENYCSCVGINENNLWSSKDLKAEIEKILNIIKIKNPTPLFSKFEEE